VSWAIGLLFAAHVLLFMSAALVHSRGATMTKIDFRPETNGFAFVNSFEFTDPERAALLARIAPTVDLALADLGPFGLAARLTAVRDKLGSIALSAMPQRYGLCGGIAFAAADYFRSGMPIPRGSGPNDQPPPGSPLRDYLWQRLLQSWELNGVTFLEWKARLLFLPQRWPFDAGPAALRRRSEQQWAALQVAIDGGSLVPVGLVGERADPFLDHQVLAYGYDRLGERSGTIYVYDSNCPGSEQTIAVDFGSDVLLTTESCSRLNNPLRGFFCESYGFQTPPSL
jgi:hypothetical protein